MPSKNALCANLANYLVEMHVEADPQMTVARAHDISHKVKDHVRQRVPQVSDGLIHIEPSR